ncbi:hypothetical protein [Lacinutrix salivirga]
MRTKWYFGALLLILTYFGVSQNQVDVPNQEIVIQFTHGEVSTNTSQTTINAVKEQLIVLGVSNVKVEELHNGQLKIKYYSSTNSFRIKQKLLSNRNLSFKSVSKEKDSLPSENHKNQQFENYNLEVFDIKTGDPNSGLNNKYVFELKQEYIRFYNPNSNAFSGTLPANEFCNTILFKNTSNKTIVLAIDYRSYNIPEVRAGPNC